MSDAKPDLDQARWFLDVMARDGDVVLFSYTGNWNQDQRLNRTFLTPDSDDLAKLGKLNEEGAAIGWVVNRTDGMGRANENMIGARWFVVDLDGDEGVAALDKVVADAGEPHLIVESSPGKFHCYWPVEDRTSNPQACKAAYTQRALALAERCGGDKKVAKLATGIRMPGFIHQKTKDKPPFLSHIFRDGQDGRVTTLTDLEDSAVTKPAVRLPEYLNEGSRNDMLYRHACSLIARGDMVPEAIEGAVQAQNVAKCVPPLSEREVRALLKSALRHYEQAVSVGRAEPLTDVGNGRRLVRVYGEDLRYVPEFHNWLLWSEGRWVFDDGTYVMRYAKHAANFIRYEAEHEADPKVKQALAAHAKQSEGARSLHSMIEMAQSEAGMAVPIAALDQNAMLLGVANGTVDLASGTIADTQRQYYVTMRAPVIFDEAAQCPLWLRFLDRIFKQNPALIRYLQKALGYSLTGRTTERCIFVLYGSGANGKTTLVNVARALLGDYSRQVQADSLMVKSSGGSVNNDLARLRGARLVAAVETEDGRRLAESLIKQLSGGDAVAARFLYKEYFEFSPQFKIWLATNHRPIVRGADHAIWDRIKLIPFEVAIPADERDPKLLDKLRAELPGILNWALEGCLAWQREGLGTTPEVENATKDYRNQMDVIGAWISERCVVGENQRSATTALYRSFQRWAEDANEFVLRRRDFKQQLVDRGFDEKVSTFNNDSARGFTGIGLRAVTATESHGEL